MTLLSAADFSAFFEAIHGYPPFPWQVMLAERVIERGWPESIDLPTASGKTACLDVGIFALACAAGETREYRAARRIFFVVDRRILVDAAYERGLRLQKELRAAKSGIVGVVATRLRELAGGAEPLVVSRIRGGTVRDLAWRSSPLQPAIVTGTVDQVGSRLLFRGYGTADLAAPIDAALTGCDSLILLDEAHCSVPFLQTARSVVHYGGGDWAEEPVVAPLSFTILSATPPAELTDVFPAPETRAEALAHPELERRTGTAKPVLLALAKAPPAREWTLGERLAADPLVQDAAQRAAQLVREGYRRVAVMVNRVATAAAVAEQLRAGLPAEVADVVLMTGRMRPIDRDELTSSWIPFLAAGTRLEPPRPILLVTTQCLEVGADFSFDALLTECASLDALRQRFGRLDRLGREERSTAVVLVRKAQIAAKAEPDPIYGAGLKNTWEWLNEQARNGRFDFGIRAVDEILPADPAERRARLAPLLAPALDAPVLLPAHLDLWTQTAPRPSPDPEVSVFLHGPDRGTTEARLVWRADLLPGEGDEAWLDTMGLVPPAAAEALSLPLFRLRRWLAGENVAAEDAGDVESAADEAPDVEAAALSRQRFLIWRGRERSVVTRDPRAVRPGDTVVVAADEDRATRLGALFQRPPGTALDVAERAYPSGKGLILLRAHPRLLAPWKQVPAVAELLDWAAGDAPKRSEGIEVLRRLAEYAPQDDAPPLPAWLGNTARAIVRSRRLRILAYPAESEAGARILLAPAPGAQSQPLPMMEDEEHADADDLASASDASVLLQPHLEQVRRLAERFARGRIPPPLVETVALAGQLHDLGKADDRFQALLHGSLLAALASGAVLAKSASVPRSARQRRAIRAASGLPAAFRHEMLSSQLAERRLQPSGDDGLRDLMLHLIESHHGHARPFAPVSPDPEPPPVALALDGLGSDLELSAEDRCRLLAPHRVESGVSERFWRLTRRHGWWGLAYLETLVRLADWEASRAPEDTETP